MIKTPPKGIVQPDGRIKIAVSLPRDLFARLCARVGDLSFSEVIADFATCGLFDVEESEANELKEHQDDRVRPPAGGA